MVEITLNLAVDTYDRIVEMLIDSGYSDLSVDRFIEKLLINVVHHDENV